MNRHRTFKLFLAGLLALTLAGCLPIPVIDIDPATLEAGESFTVDGSGTVVSNVPAGTVVASYAWDFGDGKKGQGAQVDHVYDEPGEYTITLTVTDSAGRVAEAEQPVTVKPASRVATEASTTSTTGTATTAP
ncbi:MAG: PKD domain-containing protein [Hydrogenophaga sp.]|jgi:PKD repeat protein|uniref:PKD domain-containing protein n=1 Tax=Hydrogenophaga sp. TaxID=1904254 RepID=UPI0027180546|nr:PKD domain-containing protein [Hydrogenophaga sp.]MDO9250615.1 PKD domain-containing protein [Hydrogenophaga sp.]MDP2406632.1 PKD domain-containing protein [Hydrogenophaga sp.]MDP3326248.1 PKD domain-containing protein [Hydrogenophaga sp.]MDZ4177012.1 PKD domain-containing protein [Hydrogenophaga sp.]